MLQITLPWLQSENWIFCEIWSPYRLVNSCPDDRCNITDGLNFQWILYSIDYSRFNFVLQFENQKKKKLHFAISFLKLPVPGVSKPWFANLCHAVSGYICNLYICSIKTEQFSRRLGVPFIGTFTLATGSPAYNGGCCPFPKRVGLP